MNKAVSFLRKKDLYLAIIRYALAGEMMVYGLLKINGLQANLIAPFTVWQTPLERLPGYQLTWAFLGHASWFAILLGFFEFVPACLLLFRRTILLGAVLLLPMTLSVFLINQALELWTITRWLSTGLLILNLSIFLFEWKRLKLIADILIDKTKRLSYSLPEAILNIAVIGIVIYVGTFRTFYDKHEKNDLMGDWFHRHQFEYNLVSEKIKDSTLPHHMVRAYFGPRGVYSEINDSMDNGSGSIRYTINEREHLIDIRFYLTERSASNYYHLLGKLHYELIGDSLLMLQKKTEDPNEDKHTWVFRKRVMNMRKILAEDK